MQKFGRCSSVFIYWKYFLVTDCLKVNLNNTKCVKECPVHSNEYKHFYFKE